MTEVLIHVIRSLENAYANWQKQETDRQKIVNKPSPAKRAKKRG